jgi:hypothetical protein
MVAEEFDEKCAVGGITNRDVPGCGNEERERDAREQTHLAERR